MTDKDEKEWMLQAEYDMRAAEKMFETGVYPYTIFMCHLSIEKALKALYVLKLKKEPPKMHDILALTMMLNLEPEEEIMAFIRNFSSASVRARYPKDIKATLKEYDAAKTESVLETSKKALKWLGEQLNRE